MAAAVPVRPEVFVKWFRAAAPYIHAFRGKVFVVAFGGEVITDNQFVEFAHDVNLLTSLGVKLVLVHGARPQVEARLRQKQLTPHYVRDLRVTDGAALICVKEAVGEVRTDIEALLSMGLANSPMQGADIRVASGNFVTAKPAGIIDGVDLQHTGEVRKVDAAAIVRRLDAGEIVLVSPLGYSPTGEVFNLALEEVAAQVAVALKAQKLIFFINSNGLSDSAGELLRELTAGQATRYLAEKSDLTEDERIYLPRAVNALAGGVGRAHLISRHLDGALLQELFTHEGIGTMITQSPLEILRWATIEDVGGILALIEPLESEGVLVRRSRERLEQEIGQFCVIDHDGLLIGCAALYPFADHRSGEMACLAVQKEYRDSGRGDGLLQFVTAEARRQGLQQLFVLTTRTAHWFLERGFVETGVDTLPEGKKQLYNYQRRSKVFVKAL